MFMRATKRNRQNHFSVTTNQQVFRTGVFLRQSREGRRIDTPPSTKGEHFALCCPSPYRRVLSWLGALMALAAFAVAGHAQVVLPEVVDFEAAEGYALASLNGVKGWTVTSGQVDVTDRAFSAGNRSMVLAASNPPAGVLRTYAQFSDQEILFFDVYTRLVAAPEISESTKLDIRGSRLGLVRRGSLGTVYAYTGDVFGGGRWQALDYNVALDLDGRSADWLRVTVRQDYRSKTWDLTLNGRLLAFDLVLADAANIGPASLKLVGSTMADSYFDSIYTGNENPLFADQDKDGMDDVWELANGLNPLINDRITGKISNIRRFQQGDRVAQGDAKASIPTVAAVAGDVPNTLSGMRLYLKPDVGVVVDGNGKVSTWQDQSGQGKDATQTTAASRPDFVSNQINGLGVLRFTAANSQSLSLSSVMTGATEGDAFIVVKTTVNGTAYGIWDWSSPSTAAYPSADGRVQEVFGASAAYTVGKPAQALDQYHIYNVSGKSGEWIARINGQPVHRTTANGTPVFAATAKLGTGGSSSLTGDIAEVVVYGRVLTETERDTIGSYLAQKYALVAAPSSPTGLVAAALSNTQVSLTWTTNAAAELIKYDIERQTGSGAFVLIATVRGGSYVDSTAAAGTAYAYRISARSYGGTSAASAAASVTTPSNISTLFPSSGLRLWLKADDGSPAGILPWIGDQSTGKKDAYQTVVAQQPTVVANQINGRPVFRFAGSNQGVSVTNFMSGATAGEMFAVLRSNTTGVNGIWNIGGASGGAPGTYYPDVDGLVRDDFGSTVRQTLSAPVGGFASFHLYNVNAQANVWENRYNGVSLSKFTSNTVGFKTTPTLGFTPARTFVGDLAEFIVFDRVLSTAERDAVGVYLTGKYAFIAVPNNPPTLVGAALGSTRVGLSWGAATASSVTYTVERSVAGGAFSVLGEVTNAQYYADETAVAGTTYDYRVKARNYAGSSGYSVVTVTTPLATEGIPTSGMRLWLRADLGIVPGAVSGSVQTWIDQSTAHLDATQTTTPTRAPSFVASAVNGRPAVRFNGNDSGMNLPNVMQSSAQGEVFAVLKVATTASAQNRNLWSLGSAYNFYPLSGGGLQESFGVGGAISSGAPIQDLTQTHLYNVSAKSGSWENRINGFRYLSSTSATVSFSTTAPSIGYTGSLTNGRAFDGDIAEVIVYNRALTDEERERVARELNQRYAFQTAVANAPTNLAGIGLAGSQVLLTWKGDQPNYGLIYEIERRAGAGAYTLLTEIRNGLSFIDNTVSAGTPYSYRVRARNLNGRTAYTSTLDVTTPSAAGTLIPTAGMRVWLRADTMVATGPVLAWPDQTAALNDAKQATVNVRPTLVADAINGRPALRFNGVNTSVVMPNIMAGATQGEVFAVLKVTAPLDANPHSLWTLGSGENWYPLNNTSKLIERFGTTGTPTGATPQANLTLPHFYNVSAASTGAWSSRINGVTYLSITGNTVSFSVATPALGRTFAGDIAEVMVYDNVLSATDRQAVEAYLAQKYAIAIVAPGTPASFNANVNAGGQVALSWVPGSGSVPGTKYTLERQSGSGGFVPVAEIWDGQGFVDQSAAGGSTYNYRIKATNSVGSSAYSGQVTAVVPLNSALAITSDDADADGIRDVEEAVLGSSPAVPATPDTSGSLKLRVYLPKPNLQ
jgi:hypothetical protein